MRAIAAALALAASPAGAGTLEVAPTTLVLGKNASASVLYVNNYGNAPVTVQIEPFDWGQADGNDRLTASETLMVSPPIAAIPAQGRQTVRVMLAPAATAGERSFRLLVSQLPDPMAHSDHSVQVLTQFSVPVFTTVAPGDSEKIAWDAVAGGHGLELTAHNPGARHAKLTDLELVTRRGEKISIAGGKLDYILAGSTRRWKIANIDCAAGDTLRIEGNDQSTGARLDDALVVRP
ncbi:MAG TPA: fimbria/pilus periplasmic chaperone [Rhizomicrobium sp.]